MNIQRTAIAAIVMTIAGAATADVARVAEFDSLQMEQFDSERWTFDSGVKEVFGGIGEVFGEGGWIHTTGGWSLGSGDWRGRVDGRDGNFLGNTRGSIVYQFNDVQQSFGGFFATNTDVADGIIQFFDASDLLVGESTVAAAVGGDWSWNGWAINAGFTSVKVTANYNNGAGGFLMHDDIRVSNATVPAPGAIALLLTGGLMTKRRRNA